MGRLSLEEEILLQNKIKAELPREALRRQPQRVLILIPVVSFIVVATWALVKFPAPWYLALIDSLLLGFAYGTMTFFAHEVLHGSVFRSRRTQDFFGFLCFLHFFVPPRVWRIWHIKLHHEKPNHDDDPDGFGSLDRFENVPYVRIVTKYLAPGSGHFLSFFFLFYWFVFRTQLVIWKDSAIKPGYERMNRKKAKVETLLMISFWVVLGFLLGFRGFFFGILIPILVADFIIMSYIATNHLVRPRAKETEQFEVTLSVTTWKFLDWVSLNFSHHLEHHLFPSMNWKFTPLVRKGLIRHAGDHFLCPSRWKTLWVLYHTPRVYKDNETLINPYTGRTVKIAEIEDQLRKNEKRNLQDVQSSPI